jgi:hypothetical protein
MPDMKNRFACVLLAGLLAACGQTTSVEAPAPQLVPEAPESASPAIPTDATAGPSGADNMTWRFDMDGRNPSGTPRPRLMYASNGSEGMGINLQCDPGANSAFAILWRGEQKPAWPFTLQSGAARTSLTGTGVGESEVVVTARLALDAPALVNFRNSGELQLVEGDVTAPMNAINAAEQTAVSGFFQACA